MPILAIPSLASILSKNVVAISSDTKIYGHWTLKTSLHSKLGRKMLDGMNKLKPSFGQAVNNNQEMTQNDESTTLLLWILNFRPLIYKE